MASTSGKSWVKYAPSNDNRVANATVGHFGGRLFNKTLNKLGTLIRVLATIFGRIPKIPGNGKPSCAMIAASRVKTVALGKAFNAARSAGTGTGVLPGTNARSSVDRSCMICLTTVMMHDFNRVPSFKLATGAAGTDPHDGAAGTDPHDEAATRLGAATAAKAMNTIMKVFIFILKIVQILFENVFSCLNYFNSMITYLESAFIFILKTQFKFVII